MSLRADTTGTVVVFDQVWTGDGFSGPTAYRIDGDALQPSDPIQPSDPLQPSDAPQPSDPLQPSDAPQPSDPLQPSDALRSAGTLRIGGTLFPRLTDHHVHLGLVDAASLFAGGITHLVDLGWIPAVASTWLRDDPRLPRAAIAGALITAPGGYPTRSGWAPAGAAREAGGPRAGREAVREQVMAGASRIKVALNTDAGETVDDRTLRAIVEESTFAGLPVVVHAQGPGQTERAVRAGATQLAHTPFSERVHDQVIESAVAQGMSWVSTLDIHGWGTPTPQRAIAIDNLRRFHAAGGLVLYGTDLGNGPLPAGIDSRELEALFDAGLTTTDVLRTIADGPDAAHLQPGAAIGPRFAWTPARPPADASRIPAWLATARGVHASDLETLATARTLLPTSRTPLPTSRTEGSPS
jgi:hypothetical protein